MKGKKREDLLVSDPIDNYKSLCEVKGTLKTNPPDYYVSQLSNHMRKNPDKTLKGLLIVNYDYKRHPNQRTLIYKEYESGAEGLLSADDITVLSTVDLYRIAIAVKRKQITKEKAREIVKQPGIEVFHLIDPVLLSGTV